MFAQAVEIADESMLAQLQSHAICLDEFRMNWGLIDEQGTDVSTLEEADPAIVESVKWLKRRGLCEVTEGQSGAVVLLIGIEP